MESDGCDECGMAYSFNAFDCEPNNPDKQDKWKNKFNLKGKSKVNSILNKIMR